MARPCGASSTASRGSACCGSSPGPSRHSPPSHPVVLVLEDLHWSDYATLDLIAFLVQRRAPAWLLLLGTYRPVEVIVRGHPLKAATQDLVLHRQCVELRLEDLGPPAVTAYLETRFPQALLPVGLGSILHH